MKKVTVMIPTYNQSKYIEQCVESAMIQNYPNLEILISDDSTNDETEKIIQDNYLHDSRINYIRNTFRLGRVGNYHHTLYEKATGEYVLNLDGDDWLIDPEYISKAVQLLDLNSEVICVIARIMYFHETENRLEEGPGYEELLPIDEGNKFLYLNSLGKAPVNHLTVLYRKDKAMDIGFYDKEMIWSDTESIFRLMCHNKVAFVNTHVGVWRIHSANESKKFYCSTPIKEIFSLEESVFNFCQNSTTNHFINSKKWLYQMKYFHSLEFFVNAIKTSNYQRLLQFLIFLLKTDKLFIIQAIPKLILTLSERASKYILHKIPSIKNA